MGRKIILYSTVVVVVVVVVVAVFVGRRQTRSMQIRGELLAAKYCGGCHAIPSPDVLTKREWDYALTHMGLLLAQVRATDVRPRWFDAFSEERMRRRRLTRVIRFLEQASYALTEPAMPAEDWNAIWTYYTEAAPTTSSKHDTPLEGTSLFGHEASSYRTNGGITTLVKIDADRHEVWAGEAATSKKAARIRVLASCGRLVGDIALPGTPVRAEVGEHGTLVTLIGDVFPLPHRKTPGSVLLFRSGILRGAPETVASDLERPVMATRADWDGDGVRDLVVSSFGFGMLRDGGVYVVPSRGGAVEPEVLWSQPGVLHAEVADLWGDHRPALIVLVGGGREGIYVLQRNVPQKSIQVTPVFEAHPAFGFTSMRLADMDGDGDQDVVAVNGDNTDSNRANAPRSYHGVRVFQNLGGGKFVLSAFIPMQGASMSAVADFDGDGDMDMVVAAAYPRLEDSESSSVYFVRQNQPFSFEPLRVTGAGSGRWVTVDAGDLDGDGDVDVVMGALDLPLGTDPLSQSQRLIVSESRKRGSAYLVLRNRTRTSEPCSTHD